MDYLLTVEYVCKYLNGTGGGFALKMMAMTCNKYQIYKALKLKI
jgi:hypothetical protein